ncbi:MAG TPA: reductive dehalogenase [Alphaproteobacteria bacterium]|nr:reductive dehalogenase [Alphaproteobacteria bacterium]
MRQTTGVRPTQPGKRAKATPDAKAKGAAAGARKGAPGEGHNVPDRLSLDNQPKIEEKFDGELRRTSDPDCGFEIEDGFQRFNACNDAFARAQWDERVRTERGIQWFKGMFMHGIGVRGAEGYQRKDFAIRNAAWVGANLLIERNLANDRHEGFLDDLTQFAPTAPDKEPVEDPSEMAKELKQVAAIFGADLIGVTATDLRWHYTKRFTGKTLSEKENVDCSELPNCVVVGTEMPGKVIQTMPSALGGTAAGYGYSKDGLTLMSIAQFIRNMGYRAVASLNDTAQCVPYAIQAGLGEYGRHGLVITKEYGPRLRFGKIFTDMPLAHDRPARFGVKEFCDICQKCADACPPKAIPHGQPDGAMHNQSNFVGIKKWNVDGEKCFQFWAKQGTECGICIRVCPYNKLPENGFGRLYFRLWKRLAGSPLRRFALWLDNALGYGKRLRPEWWWKNRPGW